MCVNLCPDYVLQYVPLHAGCMYACVKCRAEFALSYSPSVRGFLEKLNLSIEFACNNQESALVAGVGWTEGAKAKQTTMG